MMPTSAIWRTSGWRIPMQRRSIGVPFIVTISSSASAASTAVVETVFVISRAAQFEARSGQGKSRRSGAGTPDRFTPHSIA
jgi:hypothetical protein